jgi:biopolymer transport protein ExbD
MAQIELQSAESKKTKRKHHAFLRIDMTPMVDLGFLLITFFIFTTTLSEKRAMKLFMPNDKGDLSPVEESRVLTALLGRNNNVYVYEGKFDEALKENKIIRTSYSESNGMGELIRKKQKQLQQTNSKEGKNALILLIKPTSESSYRNVIDALDETIINGVKKYMIRKPDNQEKKFLQ